MRDQQLLEVPLALDDDLITGLLWRDGLDLDELAANGAPSSPTPEDIGPYS